MEQQMKHIEKNGRSIQEQTLEMNKIRMDIDISHHDRDRSSSLRRKQPITESKGFLKIDKYTGGQTLFRQWKHQVTNLMCSHEPELREMLKTIEQEKDVIDPDILEYDPNQIDNIHRLNEELYSFFTLTLGGEALTISESCVGNGFEVWRLLTKEYDAKTPQNLQALLTGIIQPVRVKSLGDVSVAINRWEVHLRDYMTRTGKDIDESLKICAIRAIVPKDVDDYLLKMSMHTKGYLALRSYLEEQVQHHRANGPRGMDLNPLAGDAGDPYSYEEYPVADGDDMPLDYFTKGQKGQKGKGKGKGKDGKGEKGKGKGKGGKGPTEPFQGYCGYCWNWGHKKADCRTRLRAEATPGAALEIEGEEESMACSIVEEVKTGETMNIAASAPKYKGVTFTPTSTPISNRFDVFDANDDNDDNNYDNDDNHDDDDDDDIDISTYTQDRDTINKNIVNLNVNVKRNIVNRSIERNTDHIHYNNPRGHDDLKTIGAMCTRNPGDLKTIGDMCTRNADHDRGYYNEDDFETKLNS